MKMSLVDMKAFVLNCSKQKRVVTPKEILTVASILYMVSNIGWLFAHGVFWDDWVIYENPVGIEQMMKENGSTWAAHHHLFLLRVAHQFKIDVVLLYRLIVLFFGWVNLFLYYFILKEFKFDNVIIFFSTIMFASWPLGYSHMLMCCISYQLGVCCQLISILLFLRLVTKNQDIIKALLVSFFIFLFQFLASLLLHSSIVFWLGFLCLMATIKTINEFGCSYKYALLWVKKILLYSLYFIPCLLFWVLRQVYWMPTGDYLNENYNMITFEYVVQTPLNTIKALLNIISFIFEQFSFIFSSIFFFLCFITIFVIFVFSKKYRILYTKSLSKSSFYAYVFLFICSIAAYVLVGKVPVFNHVNDRFGVLMALVVPLIIIFLIVYFTNSSAYKIVFVFVSLFCTYSLSQSIEGIRLSHRNDAIVEFFKNNELPSGNVIVSEECPKLRSNYYTWSGLYYKATGYQDRCFECVDVGVLCDDINSLKEMYHQKDAKKGSPNIIIYFVDEEGSKSYLGTLRRLCMFFTDKVKYRQMLLNDFQIRWGELV